MLCKKNIWTLHSPQMNLIEEWPHIENQVCNYKVYLGLVWLFQIFMED